MRPNQHDVLAALLTYHYLTLRQLRRLLGYAPSSEEFLQRLLRGLVRDGYLAVEELPRPASTAPGRRRGGSGQYVYKLTRQSHQVLAQLGHAIPGRARTYLAHTDPFLTHTVECSELLLLCALLTHGHPQVSITTMRHERDLQHLPQNRVTIADPTQGQRTVRYSPDGYVNFLVAGATPYEAPILFELDRGTEHQAAWRRRVRAMLAYNHGPHLKAFGTEYLTVAVVTTAGFTRLQELHVWTNAELEALQAPAVDVNRFVFGSFALSPTTPDDQRPTPFDFLGAKHWYPLRSQPPVPLLEHIE
jgi:hypothetical protein